MNFNLEYKIIDLQYFPLINWCKYANKISHIKILSCDRYQKMSFRNRTPICGSNGLIHLSVPLEKGRNQKVQFRDVTISYRDNWQLTHWRGILSCYSKSPFFEFYRDGVEKLIMNQEKFLFDLNLSILEWLISVLKLSVKIEIEHEPGLEINEDNDMRDKWLPKNFQDDVNCVTYQQVFEDRIGFQKNVSILDLLFNMGPASLELLK